MVVVELRQTFGSKFVIALLLCCSGEVMPGISAFLIELEPVSRQLVELLPFFGIDGGGACSLKMLAAMLNPPTITGLGTRCEQEHKADQKPYSTPHAETRHQSNLWTSANP